MTYEDWIKNPTPRMMWVWDNDENRKSKEKVVYISEIDELDKVLSVYQSGDVIFSVWRKHCAEIKEETKKETRLTNYEVSQLLKCFGVEWWCTNVYVHSDMMYECKDANKGISTKNIQIRYKQGEWEEPTRETVWKWWGEETPDSDISRFVSFMDWDKE